MDVQKSSAEKNFFEDQLPKFIAAFVGADQTPPDFLKKLYYGWYDPSVLVDSAALHLHDTRIIACQKRLQEILTSTAWEAVEEYRHLLDERSAEEREQAFEAGYKSAVMLIVAGLTALKKE